MRYIDIFNGDADGILSLLQLRLAQPRESLLVTGVKRDNQLMNNLEYQAQDCITVLDISMLKNISGLQRALECGAHVEYFDHHQAGDIPQHANLQASIDTASDVCTALLVDQHLEGRYHHWAIAAAYGDNLVAKADELAQQAGLSAEQAQQLRELGTLVNYNGYGPQLADLHFAPADLFKRLLAYHSPFELITDKGSVYHQLKLAYEGDMALASSIKPYYQSQSVKVIVLPNQAWARRVSGVLSNQLANQTSSLAHLVITEGENDSAVVSLRAPLNNKQGA
ncbi:DHH family phosphoesterase, partial [Agarivorans sp.]|uniref:DHH family phosphoesterase n=1 Tax=Agarivorans sp. TaxID=1872412 RepID=UPI003D048395